MPIDNNLKKVMLIGSGPIVIGQAAEFDYAGTQACRVLKALGLSVVLVNSNPATIMTDANEADKIYIEPLTLEVVKRIIEKERPDGLISTIGGQMGLTLSMQLALDGYLDAHGVKLLGASLETIDRAEDRKLFKQTMEKLGQPSVPSEVVTDIESAVDFARSIGYPVIVRPAFTLGGSGGGIAKDEAQLRETARTGLDASPIRQILVERCISGWKEIEFEVVRDKAGNRICVCSMENLDPVGIHTGDSIVVAPSVTLANTEYEMLRTAALDIIEELGVQGGCNVQFALNPESMEYAVIEVNPRVSRSSALASKATGYPIAKVAAQLAVGLTLDEIPNAVTNKTTAFFEPAVDYIVVKFPKWPFDKFVSASRTLGTQMKATGEVMSVAPTFEEAFMKAVRGVEIKQDTPDLPALRSKSDEELLSLLDPATDERIFAVFEALRRGITPERIHELTLIDEWFLYKLKNLADYENRIENKALDKHSYVEGKRLGFPDAALARLSGASLPAQIAAGYRMVDTCAAEFRASTPYFYSAFGEMNEAQEFKRSHDSGKRTIIVFGSGPIRIGQGIEFDYASVHCVETLKKLGCDVVMVNNNPETVSTDFDTADRLYFEPLTPEDVINIIETEKPYGAVVTFGGQTSINLTKTLCEHGVRILGTSADSIDMAEDRERFDAALERLGIKRPLGHIVYNKQQALEAAAQLGYPVLIRPSYVLGGKNMIIAYNDEDTVEYMDIITASSEADNTILVDKYLVGQEVEVDAICDGEDVLIPGIMEHIERAGVHSGDSIAVYPAWNLSGPVTAQLVECTERLAKELKIVGLINIQYVVHNNGIYVIEANPRASRTVPYISKVTKLPIASIATRALLGEKLRDMGYGTGLWRKSVVTAVKVPVFSFEKLGGVDSHLGPEMKSTGEVLGVGKNLEEALYKGLLAAGFSIASSGGVLVTMRPRERFETTAAVRRFKALGFTIFAPLKTAAMLSEAGIPCVRVEARGDERAALFALLESGKVNYVLASAAKGQLPDAETIQLRRKAVEYRIACLSSIDTANALVNAIESGYSERNIQLFDIEDIPDARRPLHFVKMRACGNDYIYFDCFEQRINNPESLSVWLSSRRKSIGGDGVVMISECEDADARMRMYNADGTEGEVAGNALRCVAKYLFESGRVRKHDMTIRTGGGVKSLRLFTLRDEVYSVAADMGKPDFHSAAVPALTDEPELIDADYSIGGMNFRITCLSMGNPHAVVFVDDVDALELEKIGPLLENAPIFPNRANVSFASVYDRMNIKMRVWERGIGETWACGTGACAVACAAVRLGKCDMASDITLHLRGGELVVNWSGEGVTLTGDAQKDYEGVIEV